MASSLMYKVTILSHDAYAHCSSFVYNVIVVLPPPAQKLIFLCLTYQDLNALRIECMLVLLAFSVDTFRQSVNIFLTNLMY